MNNVQLELELKELIIDVLHLEDIETVDIDRNMLLFVDWMLEKTILFDY